MTIYKIKSFIKSLIFLILRTIRKIIEIFKNHCIPGKIIWAPGYYAYNRFIEEELNYSYNYFKKYFYTSIFLPQERLRKYAIKRALENDPDKKHFYIEFGVYKGTSINFFSKILKKEIYGFDSFEGFNEDWIGHAHAKGDFSMNKNIPQLEKNVKLEIGWVQDTLPRFIEKKNKPKINFIHMDMDTYGTSKFILENIKPHLIKGSIICFDELYNFEGWKVGEFKALTEVFKPEEYKYLCFSSDGAQVVIEYIVAQN